MLLPRRCKEPPCPGAGLRVLLDPHVHWWGWEEEEGGWEDGGSTRPPDCSSRRSAPFTASGSSQLRRRGSPSGSSQRLLPCSHRGRRACLSTGEWHRTGSRSGSQSLRGRRAETKPHQSPASRVRPSPTTPRSSTNAERGGRASEGGSVSSPGERELG